MRYLTQLVVSEAHEPEYCREVHSFDSLEEAVAKAKELEASGELYNASVRIEVEGWRQTSGK